jgi:hypothetical protein
MLLAEQAALLKTLCLPKAWQKAIPPHTLKIERLAHHIRLNKVLSKPLLFSKKEQAKISLCVVTSHILKRKRIKINYNKYAILI